MELELNINKILEKIIHPRPTNRHCPEVMVNINKLGLVIATFLKKKCNKNFIVILNF